MIGRKHLGEVADEDPLDPQVSLVEAQRGTAGNRPYRLGSPVFAPIVVQTLAGSPGPVRMLRFCLILGFAAVATSISQVSPERIQRQTVPNRNGEVIERIFNIPISAIKQTSAAAQAFSPENTQTIDTVFKIPVATLEAVGGLVKATSSRRQQNAEQLQRIGQERKNRAEAFREEERRRKVLEQNQKLQDQQDRERLYKEERERERQDRLRIYQERLEQQKFLHRSPRHHDPFGLNAFTNLLVGHHGIFGGFGSGWVGGHGGLGHISSFADIDHHSHGHKKKKKKKKKKPVHLGAFHDHHGANDHGSFLADQHSPGHGGHGSQHHGAGISGLQTGYGSNGIHGILSGLLNGGSHSYEVHEHVDEGNSFWPGFGNFYGPHTSFSGEIQNKIAPKEERAAKTLYQGEGRSNNESNVQFPRKHENTAKNTDELTVDNNTVDSKSNRVTFSD
ncbi:uncharacterized protein [Prorops nasuta]|uniref:uncharacterized protein n=1 Tax=Prorops nasuta TaxID=863751 RepID=UPI0034CE275D